MVVELETDLKRQLYATLAIQGLTFKGWLIEQAEKYLAESARRVASEPSEKAYKRRK